jgi:type IV pilus biogenesis protein CpaD/CtpE
VAKLNRLLLLAVPVACAALAAGCSSAPRVDVPTEVRVRVPVACVDAAERLERPPLRSRSDLIAMDRYRRTLAVWSEWLELQAYAAKLEALVEGCSRIKP